MMSYIGCFTLGTGEMSPKGRDVSSLHVCLQIDHFEISRKIANLVDGTGAR